MFHALEKGWTTTDYLLAHVIDGVRVNNWQRTEGARKKPPRDVPEPFPRPADMERKKQSQVGDISNVGGAKATVITVEEYIQRRIERERRWRQIHEQEGG